MWVWRSTRPRRCTACPSGSAAPRVCHQTSRLPATSTRSCRRTVPCLRDGRSAIRSTTTTTSSHPPGRPRCRERARRRRYDGDQCAHEPALARRDQASETRDRDRVALEPGQPGLRGQQLARPQHGAARQRHVGRPGRVRRRFQRPQRRVGARRPPRPPGALARHPPAGAQRHRGMLGEPLQRHTLGAGVRPPRSPRRITQRLPGEQHVLGLAAHPLDIRAADELAQASAPDLPHALGRCVPYDERLDAAAPDDGSDHSAARESAAGPAAERPTTRREPRAQGGGGRSRPRPSSRPAWAARPQAPRTRARRRIRRFRATSVARCRVARRGAPAALSARARPADCARALGTRRPPRPFRCLVSPGQGQGRGRSPLTSRIV